jgi:hypothetical protein
MAELTLQETFPTYQLLFDGRSSTFFKTEFLKLLLYFIDSCPSYWATTILTQRGLEIAAESFYPRYTGKV